MSRVLAKYDISGKQKFCFSSNKLEEIIGASYAIHNALFEELPKCLREGSDDWKNNDAEKLQSGTEIVYIGGGNALVIFEDEAKYKEVTLELSKKVFEITGGNCRLLAAKVDLDDKESFSVNSDNVNKELNNVKYTPVTDVPMPCLPIVKYDDASYEPIIVENGKAKGTRSAIAKLAQKENPVFSGLCPKGKEFATEFRTDDDGNKNFVAIVHLDGNTMGSNLIKFTEGLNGELYSDMIQMSEKSKSISKVYLEILKEVINELYKSYSIDSNNPFKLEENQIPFRPVIADGDDITVMIEASQALRFVELFTEKLEKKTEIFEDYKATAGAGIAFVKTSFPFYTGYNIAEECCSNAKKQTLERFGSKTPYSSVDFQLCYSDIGGDVDLFRMEHYEISSGYNLVLRPYAFRTGVVGKKEAFTYEDLCTKFDDFYIEVGSSNSKKIARSKLKGLRDAYSISQEQAQNYAFYIKSHQKGVCKLDDTNVINTINGTAYANYFDFLDLMDICKLSTGSNNSGANNGTNNGANNGTNNSTNNGNADSNEEENNG